MAEPFPRITHLNDILPHVQHKKEIALLRGSEDSYILCYLFMDKDTFDIPLARECRGIVFDREGNLVGRPIHKFFNIGEKPETLKHVLPWDNVISVTEKLDGSMIHTVWMNNKLWLKSKKAFSSDVVKIAWKFLDQPENEGVKIFCEKISKTGFTAIFELTSPNAQIVVPYGTTQMRLLHIRENVPGKYIPLPEFQEDIAGYGVETVNSLPVKQTLVYLESLNQMTRAEGFVFQFKNSDMVKVKCPWYLRLHRSILFMRKRDIAEAVITDGLDDIKLALREIGTDITEVEAIESAVMKSLLGIKDGVEQALQPWDSCPDRKSVAIALKENPLFNLIMTKYSGKEPDYKEWYRKNRLKIEWTLDPVKGFVVDEES